jgi:hypothetical protein
MTGRERGVTSGMEAEGGDVLARQPDRAAARGDADLDMIAGLDKVS